MSSPPAVVASMATERQTEYLRDLGIDPRVDTVDLAKAEASDWRIYHRRAPRTFRRNSPALRAMLRTANERALRAMAEVMGHLRAIRSGSRGSTTCPRSGPFRGAESRLRPCMAGRRR